MRTKGLKRAGFTLLEMVISVTVLAVLAMMLILSSQASSTMTSVGNMEARLLRSGEKAMNRIVGDLRMSGAQTLNGRSYPYVYDDGAAADGFGAYAYAPAPMAAQPGDADFGVMRSIILCVPSDLDGDGRPELDADGDGVPELDGDGDGTPTSSAADTVAWDPNEAEVHAETRLVWDYSDIAYKVRIGPTGENELVRLVSNGAEGTEVLARGVERIQFDTAVSAGFTIPTGSLRVRIFFRVSDEEGHVYRSRREFLVRPRNS
ncbi:MAG: prepilin-type N-terminal cleavage/methylation domain-containing protein [Planctomycetota bacterium]|jgi:prepilin-type N-terminal cleavage/methylation domain-containing protein